MSTSYVFYCDRCDSSASDTTRHGIELFTEHHMRTVHPAQAVIAPAVALKRSRAFRRRVSSRPESGPRRARHLVSADRAGEQA